VRVWYADRIVQLNDWLTATLSVLTISLTILGVLIALIAVWGYRGNLSIALAYAPPTASSGETGIPPESVADEYPTEPQR
jgi:hypothetical protein